MGKLPSHEPEPAAAGTGNQDETGFFRLGWPSAEIPLYAVAVRMEKVLHLGLQLHPFRNDFHPQSVCHGNDVTGDESAGIPWSDGLNQSFIDLQDVHAELLQPSEKGIFRTEFIQ